MEEKKGRVIEPDSMDSIIGPLYFPHFLKFVDLGVAQHVRNALHHLFIRQYLLTDFSEVGGALCEYHLLEDQKGSESGEGSLSFFALRYDHREVGQEMGFEVLLLSFFFAVAHQL